MDFGQVREAADRASARGDYITARTALEEFLLAQPSALDESLARGTLAVLWIRLGEPDRATEEARRAVALSSTDLARASALLSSGTVRIARWHPDAASSELETTLRELSESVEIFERLGTIDFSSALLTLADAWRELGEVETAEPLYRRVVRDMQSARWVNASPSHRLGLVARALYGLTGCAVVQDRASDARSYLDNAAELAVEADDASIIQMIASAYGELFDDVAAMARLRRSLAT